MASTLINSMGATPETFLDLCSSTATAYSQSCGWLSPRISFSVDFIDDESNTNTRKKPAPCSLDDNGAALFEFRPDDPVSMLPADELFSEGKLVPLQLPRSNSSRAADPNQSVEDDNDVDGVAEAEIVVVSEEPEKTSASASDFSPKAPRCSSRWKELLGLKKAAVQQNRPDQPHNYKVRKNNTTNSRGLKHFLHRNPRSNSIDPSLSLPLLNSGLDESSKPSAAPSRPSLSSSSDSEKTTQVPSSSHGNARPKLRASRSTKPLPDHPPVRAGTSQIRRAPDSAVPPRGASVDSPRMNSSGKIVFQNLGRSSSSPSSFNGGNPRLKHRGMERSYSAASVYITPVLNVPVCKSVFGFGPLFSQQKSKDHTTARGSSKSDKA